MADQISMVEDGGDHRLVLIPTSGTEVTFQIVGSETSANDTDTIKYMDTNKTRTRFSITANTDFEILSIDGTTFTDPIPVDANTRYTETNSRISDIKIKTGAANSTVSLRVR